MILLCGELWLSYYSSHEGDAAGEARTYLARIHLQADFVGLGIAA